jgi:hypothetical protein
MWWKSHTFFLILWCICSFCEGEQSSALNSSNEHNLQVLYVPCLLLNMMLRECSHQLFWHMILGSPQIAHNNSTSIRKPSISLTHGLGNWFVWKSAVGYCKSANFRSQHVDTLSHCGRSQWLGLFVEILKSMLCVLVPQELAELNRQYEAKFGFVFLVCASGKSSAEILSILKACFHLILSKCFLVLFLSFLKLVSTCMRERWYLVLGKLVAVALDSCS